MLHDVIFYNGFHGGDVHISRTFVRELMQKLPAQNYYYMHFNSERILLDLPQLQIIRAYKGTSAVNNAIDVIRHDDDVYINTWYGSQNYKHMSRWCNFDVLYYLFAEIYAKLQIPGGVGPKLSYLPKIDFKYYYLDNINKFLATHPQKKVFISNGWTQSGQSNNFDFNPMIERLAGEFPHLLFLVSNLDRRIVAPNICYTQEIIALQDNDLNENAYLTTACDVVIGRASGAYTFSMIEENLMNPNKTFICFCIWGTTAKWVDEAKCKWVVSNNFQYESMLNIIRPELICLRG